MNSAAHQWNYADSSECTECLKKTRLPLLKSIIRTQIQNANSSNSKWTMPLSSSPKSSPKSNCIQVISIQPRFDSLSSLHSPGKQFKKTKTTVSKGKIPTKVSSFLAWVPISIIKKLTSGLYRPLPVEAENWRYLYSNGHGPFTTRRLCILNFTIYSRFQKGWTGSLKWSVYADCNKR